jgi:hypothetical protein
MPYVSKENKSINSTRFIVKIPNKMVQHLKNDTESGSLGKSIERLANRVLEKGFPDVFAASLESQMSVEDVLIHQYATLEAMMNEQSDSGDHLGAALLQEALDRLMKPIKEKEDYARNIDTHIGPKAQYLFDELSKSYGHKASRDRVLKAMIVFDRQDTSRADA